MRLKAGNPNIESVIDQGIVMSDLDAIVAGALPDPEVETEQPGWLWRSTRCIVATDVNDYSQQQPLEFNLHSMRKFSGNNDDLELIAVNSSLGGVFLNGLVRVLVKRA